ncbi:MAG: Ig-like domain-containing protein, partial [bacterium]
MTKKALCVLLVFLLAFWLFHPGPVIADGATVSTDKAEYHQGETITISGSGFPYGAAVSLSIYKGSELIYIIPGPPPYYTFFGPTFTATCAIGSGWDYGEYTVLAAYTGGSASCTFSLVPFGTLTTDKGGYLRGATVYLSGSGFPSGVEKTLSVARASAPTTPLLTLSYKPTASSFTATFTVQSGWEYGTYLGIATYGTPTATVTCAFEVIPAPPTPTGLSGQPGRNQALLTWQSVSNPYHSGYRIYRALSLGGTYELRGTTSATNFTDSATAYSGSYYYKVSSFDLYGNESSLSGAVAVTPYGDPAYSSFENIPSQVAGIPFPVIVKARDGWNRQVLDFNSPALLSDTTGTISPVFFNFSSGSATVNVTITKADSQVKIFVVTTPTGESNVFAVLPGAVDRLSLSPSTATITAGSSQAYTLLAYDSYNNSWDVTSSASFSITPSAGGSWSANTYTSQKAGTWTITGSYGGKSATATLIVQPGAPALLSLSPLTATNVVGTSHSLTAFLRDACENPLSGYSISFQILSGHTSLLIPSAITDSSGLATTTFTATTVGTDTIRASAGTIQSNTVTKVWTASVPSSIELTPLTATNPVGVPHTLSAQVRDGFGNPVPGVTVSFNVSGAHSLGGSSGTNSSGIASFTYTATTVGTDTIRASAGTIQSNPVTKVWIQASLDHLSLSPQTATITAGGSQSYTLLAYDSFGNSWDATSSATFSITPSAGGSWSANTYTSEHAGTWTVTSSYGGQTSTATLNVLPGAAHRFQWDPISSPQQATVPFPVHVVALDALGNIATSFTGTASLSASNGAVEPSSTGNFLAGEWSGNVAVLNRGSDVTLTCQSGSISGTSNPFEVLPNSVSFTFHLQPKWNMFSL